MWKEKVYDFLTGSYIKQILKIHKPFWFLKTQIVQVIQNIMLINV